MKPLCFFLAFFSLSATVAVYAQTDNFTPQATLHTTRPANCADKGMKITKITLKSHVVDEQVDILLYLQLYNGSWERHQYSHKGSGDITVNLSNCQYTGNYQVYCAYHRDGVASLPNLEQVKTIHLGKGEQPKFRITDKAQKDGCTEFSKGEVFTPHGEQVEVTLMMEKKDGTWRKKVYQYTGTGFLDLGIKECDLTGKYKLLVQPLAQ